MGSRRPCQIVPGAAVFIANRKDPSAPFISGIVAEVMRTRITRRGVKVRLETGETGRVKQMDRRHVRTSTRVIQPKSERRFQVTPELLSRSVAYLGKNATAVSENVPMDGVQEAGNTGVTPGESDTIMADAGKKYDVRKIVDLIRQWEKTSRAKATDDSTASLAGAMSSMSLEHSEIDQSAVPKKSHGAEDPPTRAARRREKKFRFRKQAHHRT